MSIRDEFGIDRASVVGPYSEGDMVNLKCEVFGGEYILVLLFAFLFTRNQYTFTHHTQKK